MLNKALIYKESTKNIMDYENYFTRKSLITPSLKILFSKNDKPQPGYESL